MVYLEDVAAGLSGGQKLVAALQALLPAALARRWYFPRTASSLHNPATVLFSSGSTGHPKGVVLTHHNFNANANATMRVIGVRPGDRLLGSLPFFHSFGFLGTLWLPLTWGVPAVYHPSPVDAQRIGEVVAAERLTMMFATPTFLQGYTRKCTPEQFRTLRMVITGAEKLRRSIAEKFRAQFGIEPIEGYGTTELAPVVAVNMPEDLAQTGQAIGRPGAVGKPLPGISVRIVDPVSGAELDEGQEGVLHVKGPNVMPGYLDDPERTAAVLRDGWYDTGDMAKLDQDGYLYITGRLSRFSKIGGEMVPHLALEDEIHAVLGAQDSLVAVTAVADEARGERLLVLYTELALPPAEIVAALRARGLPNLWLPKPTDFCQIDRIPVLGSGKLDLRLILEMAKELGARRRATE
jgi:acyl-[acyl-carrier-protein]-phospholipid O-acyltransferase/long-chain-fatty-acid--[acyl-carrier-protein] ligase